MPRAMEGAELRFRDGGEGPRRVKGLESGPQSASSSPKAGETPASGCLSPPALPSLSFPCPGGRGSHAEPGARRGRSVPALAAPAPPALFTPAPGVATAGPALSAPHAGTQASQVARRPKVPLLLLCLLGSELGDPQLLCALTCVPSLSPPASSSHLFPVVASPSL